MPYYEPHVTNDRSPLHWTTRNSSTLLPELTATGAPPLADYKRITSPNTRPTHHYELTSAIYPTEKRRAWTAVGMDCTKTTSSYQCKTGRNSP